MSGLMDLNDVTSVLTATAQIFLMVKKVKLLTPNVNYIALLSVPVSMRLWSVVWYSQCLCQCGSALLRDAVSVCINAALVCCAISPLPVPMCSAFLRDVLLLTSGMSLVRPFDVEEKFIVSHAYHDYNFSKTFTGKCIVRPNKPT